MYTNWIHVRSQILVDNAESAWEPKDQEQNYTSNKKEGYWHRMNDHL